MHVHMAGVGQVWSMRKFNLVCGSGQILLIIFPSIFFFLCIV